MHPTAEHIDLLRDLARQAEQAGEVPIAALAFNQSGILAACYNRTRTDHSALQHAEMQCVSESCRRLGNERLTGVSLISILEPCLMCGGAIIEARVAEVFYFCPATHGPSLGDLLSPQFESTFKKDKGINHKPKLVHVPDYQEEFSERIRTFFRSRR